MERNAFSMTQVIKLVANSKCKSSPYHLCISVLSVSYNAKVKMKNRNS